MFKFTILFCAVSLVNVAYGSTDPTRPLLQSNRIAAGSVLNNKNKKLELQSIIKSGERLTAVVNDKLLKQGDQIGQYQVSKITNSYVLLVSDDNELKLSMFTQVVNAQNEK